MTELKPGTRPARPYFSARMMSELLVSHRAPAAGSARIWSSSPAPERVPRLPISPFTRQAT